MTYFKDRTLKKEEREYRRELRREIEKGIEEYG
jgi:hypothetical protein